MDLYQSAGMNQSTVMSVLWEITKNEPKATVPMLKRAYFRVK